MKILLVHNDYGKYSGEEAVVDKMSAMLSAHGHQVAFYRLSSASRRESLSGKIKGFVDGIYSRQGVAGMREALRRERPDVVNVHNLYPFVSPAALFECRKAGVPVVMTVHNFRLLCPTGLFMRDGRPCEVCLERGNEWGCVRYNCEHSVMKSIGYALRNAYARMSGAYKKNVSAYACITAFQRLKLIEGGYEVRRIKVIPNSIDVPDGYPRTVGDYVAYVGRLSYEKGFDLLIDIARRRPDIKFRFAGAQREGNTISLPGNVRLMGYLGKDELNAFIRNARFVVMPSRCYEGFPMAILEAACQGKPTVAPGHGGFTEIIGTGDAAIGSLFTPNDTDDLERAIAGLWNDPDLTARLGDKAYEKVRSTYDTPIVFKQWEALFENIVHHHKNNPHAQ